MNERPESLYASILTGLKEKFRSAQMKAVLAVNTYQLALYWEVGKTILQQREAEGWGTKIIEKLSRDLRVEFPAMKGLSVRNITYMRDFAEAYPEYPFLQQPVAELQNNENQDDTILQRLVAKLPWGHHILIFSKLKTRQDRLFYMQKCLENNWGRDYLKLQIDSQLHLRQGSAITNFGNTLPEATSDLAHHILKNPYVFDFIALSEKMQERELEKALTAHLKSFMLELGKGFAYVGNQYNLNVEGDDYFLDLLFYNTHLHCYVVFELKIGEFKPEFAGKLNFYINTIDARIKRENDAPTFGVLLCKTPNETVVKFALQGIKTPIGVAEYQLADSLPKQLKGEMPTIEQLEEEIEKEYQELKSPSEKKIDLLKTMLHELKQDPIQQQKGANTASEVFEKVLLPLHLKMITDLKEICSLFQLFKIEFKVGSYYYATEAEARDHIIKHPNEFDFGLEINFDGFMAAGVNAFSARSHVRIYLHQFKLVISTTPNSQEPFIEKLYHQLPDSNDIARITEHQKHMLLDDILRNVERLKSKEK